MLQHRKAVKRGNSATLQSGATEKMPHSARTHLAAISQKANNQEQSEEVESLTSVWGVEGCTTEHDHKQRDYLPRELKLDARAAVRCCLHTRGRIECASSSVGCPKQKTYAEGKKICEDKSMRLCSKDELESNVCCGTGCNFDSFLIWTSTEFVGNKTASPFGDPHVTAKVEEEKDPHAITKAEEEEPAKAGADEEKDPHVIAKVEEEEPEEAEEEKEVEKNENEGIEEEEEETQAPEAEEKEVDLKPGPGGHLGGFSYAVKASLSEVIGPLKEEVAALEAKVAKIASKKQERKAPPALQALEKEVDELSAALTKAQESRKAEHQEANIVLGNAANAMSTLKASLGKNIKEIASSEDIKSAEALIKADDAGTDDALETARMVKTNQKYLKQIYKDLHGM